MSLSINDILTNTHLINEQNKFLISKAPEFPLYYVHEWDLSHYKYKDGVGKMSASTLIRINRQGIEYLIPITEDWTYRNFKKKEGLDWLDNQLKIKAALIVVKYKVTLEDNKYIVKLPDNVNSKVIKKL